MRRGVYQMFGSGPDQLPGYCQQVPTMFPSSALWAHLGASFSAFATSSVPCHRSEVTLREALKRDERTTHTDNDVGERADGECGRLVRSRWLAGQQSSLASTEIGPRDVFEAPWQPRSRLLRGSAESVIARLGGPPAGV